MVEGQLVKWRSAILVAGRGICAEVHKVATGPRCSLVSFEHLGVQPVATRGAFTLAVRFVVLVPAPSADLVKRAKVWRLIPCPAPEGRV